MIGHGGGGQGTPKIAALFLEVGNFILIFNSAVFKECQDGQYQFRVHCLFKKRALEGMHLQAESPLEYTSHDDDVALVFKSHNGSK